MSFRVFYAAGPGNVIAAHQHWMRGASDPSEMSLTYSGQFADFCREIGAEAYIVSYHAPKARLLDGAFTLEHRPKPMSGAAGAMYHLSEILYGIGLVATAIRFRANAAVVVSGSTHFFVLSLLRLAGIQPVVLHNTLWPAGFPPRRLPARLILRLDSLFFRLATVRTLGVSPECLRQVRELTRGRATNLYEFRSQFHREHFVGVPPPPGDHESTFRILYAGRINRNKGVFDILSIASNVEARRPGRVRWTICGAGPDLDELRRTHGAMRLENIVDIHGWTPPEAMRRILADSHASIVPTRSDFAEGMAKTVVESILSGRPVVTSPVVPALEMLKPACVEARTDDVASYADAIVGLIDDPARYRSLCRACPDLQGQFYDRQQGMSTALKRLFDPAHIPAAEFSDDGNAGSYSPQVRENEI